LLQRGSRGWGKGGRKGIKECGRKGIKKAISLKMLSQHALATGMLSQQILVLL
jgi:hypothetical protein